MCFKIFSIVKNFTIYNCLLNLFRIFLNKTKAKCPKVYCVFFDKVNQWRVLRYTLGYLYGLFIAIIFWDAFIADLGFPIDVTYEILIGLIFVLGLGYAFSKQMRCIVYLTCAGFLGKSGRSFLRAMVFALVIAGPIANLGLNGKETIRVFACSTALTYNLTKTRFDLMTKPFVKAVFGIKDNITEIKDTFYEVEEVAQPIITEIEDEDDDQANNQTNPKRSDTMTSLIKRNYDFDPHDGSIESAEYYQQKYKNKMRHRCEAQLQKGENKCKEAFAKAYDNCYQKLPSIVNTLLCWPMKVTAVCNIQLLGFSKGEKGICDPSKIIDRDLGENFASLKETEGNFVNSVNSTKVDYAVINPKDVPGVTTAEDTGKAIITEFTRKKSLFDKFMYIVRRIMAFIFIKVIIASVQYQKKYMKNVDFDNHYITDYFKKIDERRKKHGRNGLLPLKKVELAAYIDPTEQRKLKSESRAMSTQVLKLLLEIITTLIFLMLDHIVAVLLEIVAKNARIDYYQEGHHHFIVMVNGTGIIARLLRNTLKGFNISESVSTVLTNEPCLPRPNKLTAWFYTKLFIMYFTLTVLVFNHSFNIRIRRVICSYFYPKREKQRVLHLYNKMLKRRKHVFRIMYRTVKESMLKDGYKIKHNVLTRIRLKCPIFFGWLRNFKFARRKCIICEEPEPKQYDKNRPYNFVKCKTSGCYAVHCEDCWFEVGRICLACHKLEEMEKSEVEAMDESEDDYSD